MEKVLADKNLMEIQHVTKAINPRQWDANPNYLYHHPKYSNHHHHSEL